jgi:hypothetical protein
LLFDFTLKGTIKMKQQSGMWIDITEFLRRYRWFLLFLSLAVPIAYGVYQYFIGGNYEISVRYFPSKMDCQDYLVFQSRFFSQKNLERIAERLDSSGGKEAALIHEHPERLERNIRFQSWPDPTEKTDLLNQKKTSFSDVSNTPVVQIEIIVRAKEENFLQILSKVIWENLTEDLVLDSLAEDLKGSIQRCRDRMAAYERKRFQQQAEIQRHQMILDRMKKLPPIESSIESFLNAFKVPIEFQVSEQAQFLPLSLQIQALEIQNLKEEAALEADKAEYERNHRLLELYLKLFYLLRQGDRGKSLPNTTVYRQHLQALLEETQEPDCRDEIMAEIRKAENASMEISSYPGTVQKTVFTEQFWSGLLRLFLGSLLLSMLLIFCFGPVPGTNCLELPQDPKDKRKPG